MKRIVKRFLILIIILLPTILSARHNARVKPYPERKIFSYEIQGETHWLGMGKGIIKYDAVTDSMEHITEAAGYELGVVKDIAVADSNLVWFVANDSLLLSFDGIEWKGHDFELNQVVAGKIAQITLDENGSLWVLFERALLSFKEDSLIVVSNELPV